MNSHLEQVPSFRTLPDVCVVRKPSDQTVNNSTALVNDTALLFPIRAGEVWQFEAHLIFDGPAAADCRVQWNVPAGGVLAHTIWNAKNAAGTWITTEGTAGGWLNFGTEAAGTSRYNARCTGMVINGATPGNVQLSWAQDTATVGDTKMKANSCIIARRLSP